MKDEWREFVAELKGKADIVAYVGDSVALKRAGRSYKGLCPFHAERTPSFHVDPGRQMFHCFGCGKGGDILTFAQEHLHLPFPEAVRHVAGRFGVAVPEWKPETAEEKALAARRHDVEKALELAQELFEERLYASDAEGRRARRYLKGRGIDSSIARAFGIGHAPADPGMLERRASEKGVPPWALQEAGLLRMSESGDARGAFRGRVTFAIRSAAGKLLGFGARALGDEIPKYLNSPDSALFHKGKSLYGLFEALKAIRSGGSAILVEGYLDVVSLHKAGFTTAVAPLGTALTEDQARLLHTHAKKVMVMLDGDAAGHRAALRALPILMAQGFEVSVAVLPSDADPDSLVRSGGPAGVEAVLREATNPVAFAFDELARGLEPRQLREPAVRSRIEQQIQPIIMACANPVERQSYYQIVADRLQVDERTVAEAIVKAARGPALRQDATQPLPAPARVALPLSLSEKKLLRTFLDRPEILAELAPHVSSEIFSEGARRLWEVVWGSRGDLTATDDADARDRLQEIQADPELLPGDVVEAVACVERLREAQYLAKHHECKRELVRARDLGDRARERELGGRLLELDRKRHAFSEEILKSTAKAGTRSS